MQTIVGGSHCSPGISDLSIDGSACFQILIIGFQSSFPIFESTIWLRFRNGSSRKSDHPNIIWRTLSHFEIGYDHDSNNNGSVC